MRELPGKRGHGRVCSRSSRRVRRVRDVPDGEVGALARLQRAGLSETAEGARCLAGGGGEAFGHGQAEQGGAEVHREQLEENPYFWKLMAKEGNSKLLRTNKSVILKNSYDLKTICKLSSKKYLLR